MELKGRHVVVTGGAGGIGSALARRFAAEGAAGVVVADRDLAATQAIAAEFGGLGVQADVGREDEVLRLIAEAEERFGPIDIFVSNAGVPGGLGGAETPDEVWDEAWRVNVMAHVWAARALVPAMTERGEGYLVNTASAAGLLTQVSSATYSVTKHAAVALAEWLTIEHADAGVRVSCICPQGVRTPMLDYALTDAAGAAALGTGDFLDPEDVADAVVKGIAAERLLILPHEEVAGHLALKGSDPERWLKGMRRLVRQARQSPRQEASS